MEESNTYEYRIVRKKWFEYHVESNNNFLFPTLKKANWQWEKTCSTKWAARIAIRKLRNPKPEKIVWRG